jgi:S-adenosyl methyltransferase
LPLIDFDQPVGVVIFSVLDVIDNAYDPVGIMAQVRDRMAPGSYLGVSHLSARSAGNAREHSLMISKNTGFPEVQFRSDAEVLRFSRASTWSSRDWSTLRSGTPNRRHHR